jgi:hypothetical protein
MTVCHGIEAAGINRSPHEVEGERAGRFREAGISALQILGKTGHFKTCENGLS